MRGDKTALSASQKRGFNLFMGKAACGTCHFAPVFNGLVPPNYITTEFEILGTPMNEDLEKPIADTDLGMYNVFEIEQFKGAFKTPTVRNAAETAPYMHNGAFATLEKLIDFYDKGGGAGIGLNVPQQTLSPTPLNLTKEEKADLISFIEALTDKAVQ
jgi:cytochrome c peroxidase